MTRHSRGGVVARADDGEVAPARRIKASLEHALLGLIAEGGEVSGYDLIRTFRLSMSHYWHAHQGQIYPTLERMERRGLIRSREVVQQGRPNKRAYSMTEAGSRMLMQWLVSPFEGMKLKHAPLLRCRFLGHLGADGARERLVEERAAWESYLRGFRDLERSYFPRERRFANVNGMFTYFTLRHGIGTVERYIEFCDWAIENLDRNRHLFATPRRTGGRRKVARAATALVAAH